MLTSSAHRILKWGALPHLPVPGSSPGVALRRRPGRVGANRSLDPAPALIHLPARDRTPRPNAPFFSPRRPNRELLLPRLTLWFVTQRRGTVSLVVPVGSEVL